MPTPEASSRKPETPALVCFAVKEEAAAFRKISPPGVRILITGVGQQNAARALREHLKEHKPYYVLGSGFAGGLDPALQTGDVVFFTNENFLRERISAAGAVPVKFECATRIATSSGEKQELRRATGADAVEMESAALHGICREQGIPYATVRVILDTANEDLPLDFNQLSKEDMNLSYRKLAMAIAKSPGKIGALMKLQKQAAAAAERLADALVRAVAA